MVIDAKLPAEDPAPLSAPPPAYAPSPQDSSSRGPPQPQPQQYPPPGNPPLSPPTSPPQWQNPGQGPQPTWVTGQQYQSHLLANCARGQHDVVTSFGLCGIICAILLFPIGLIFLCIDTEKKCARCGVRLH